MSAYLQSPYYVDSSATIPGIPSGDCQRLNLDNVAQWHATLPRTSPSHTPRYTSLSASSSRLPSQKSPKKKISKKKPTKKTPGPPRPPNCFIIFRSEYCQERARNPSIHSDRTDISGIAAERWKRMDEREKDVYREKAAGAKKLHAEKFPKVQVLKAPHVPINRIGKTSTNTPEYLHLSPPTNLPTSTAATPYLRLRPSMSTEPPLSMTNSTRMPSTSLSLSPDSPSPASSRGFSTLFPPYIPEETAFTSYSALAASFINDETSTDSVDIQKLLESFPELEETHPTSRALLCASFQHGDSPTDGCIPPDFPEFLASFPEIVSSTEATLNTPPAPLMVDTKLHDIPSELQTLCANGGSNAMHLHLPETSPFPLQVRPYNEEASQFSSRVAFPQLEELASTYGI